jgi:hypothetical protein
MLDGNRVMRAVVTFVCVVGIFQVVAAIGGYVPLIGGYVLAATASLIAYFYK